MAGVAILCIQLIGCLMLILEYILFDASAQNYNFAVVAKEPNSIMLLSMMLGMSLILFVKEFNGARDIARMLFYAMSGMNGLIVLTTLSFINISGFWIMFFKIQLMTMVCIPTKKSIDFVPGCHVEVALLAHVCCVASEVLETWRHHSIFAQNNFEYFRMMAIILFVYNALSCLYVMGSSAYNQLLKETEGITHKRYWLIEMIIIVWQFKEPEDRYTLLATAPLMILLPAYLSCAFYQVKYWEDRNITIYFWCNLSYIFLMYRVSVCAGNLSSAEHYVTECNLSARRHVIRHVSHEIRTPLNIIQMGLDMLQKDVNNELIRNPALQEIIPLLSELRHSCNVAVGIMDDLICFEDVNVVCSTLEARVEVNIKLLLAESIQSLNLHCREKNLTMMFCMDGIPASKSAVITVNKNKFTQAIRNVLNNAIKYSFLNGIINVHCVVMDSTVHINVMDYGRGIESKVVVLMSELLHDSTNSVKIPSSFYNSSNGTMGVGLLAARNIIHNHHGQIDIESRGINLGTTVRMKLGCVLKHDESKVEVLTTECVLVTKTLNNNESATVCNVPIKPPLTNSNEANYVIENNDQDKKFRFLIVDDAGSSRKIVNKMLTRMGHICAEADDGDTCLKMMGSDVSVPPYDVILMDNTMPRMSGLVTTNSLRRLGCTLPIIGITGNVLTDEIEEFIAQGADIVLKKPVSYDDIIRNVLKILNKQF